MITLEERIYAALTATGIEVTQIPVRGKASSYLTWELTSGRYEAYASDDAQRVNCMITVSLYTRIAPTSEDRERLFKCIRLHGMRVIGWGAVDYEDDTKWYHTPVNVRVMMKTE